MKFTSAIFLTVTAAQVIGSSDSTEPNYVSLGPIEVSPNGTFSDPHGLFNLEKRQNSEDPLSIVCRDVGYLNCEVFQWTSNTCATFLGPSFADSISSAINARDTLCIFYEDPGCTGRAYLLSRGGSQPNFLAVNFNDITSSVFCNFFPPQ